MFWLWLGKRSAELKSIFAVLYLMICFSGVIFLGCELAAMQQPVTSYFLQPLDVKMMEAHWNQMAEDSLVFDANVYRGPTIFAHANRSHQTWYQASSSLTSLKTSPSLQALRTAGYDYLYVDPQFWEGLSPDIQQTFQTACVRLMDQMQSKNGQTYRRLYDLRACQH